MKDKKKVIIIIFIILTLLLVGLFVYFKVIKKDNSQTSVNNNTQQNEKENKPVETKKLGDAISYYTKDDHIYFKVKTSAEFDAHDIRIAICDNKTYKNADQITGTKYDERAFDEDFDKEWFEGVYAFYLLKENIDGIASDSEWSPGTWATVLYEGENRKILGQWSFVAEGDGKYHFDFENGTLIGAGEDKKVEEFDSLKDEVASWFTFKEYNDEWARFYFDGYYLEETDPQGYDKYYMLICPEGNYTTYQEAMDAHIGDYAAIEEKCPYLFSIGHYGIEKGKYTIVLAKNGGNVEAQFNAEKISDTKWKLDFENAKCPSLESKYEKTSQNNNNASNKANTQTSENQNNNSNKGYILDNSGLTEDDIKTTVGNKVDKITGTSSQYVASVFCTDTKFETFEKWVNALAENCKKISKDGKLYQDEITWKEINAFELDSKALVNIVQFIYKTNGHVVYVTASSTSDVENAFNLNIQVY